MMSRRNKMKSVESLVCLVRAVENQYTTIDLQNETCVHGFVKNVDYNMNITMSDVTLTDPNNKRYYCDNFYLKSRLIRYVHLPPNIDIFSTMKDVIKKTFPPRIKTKSYSFKNKKLVARQEKLKREVQSKKKLISQLQ
ncbi:U6 snRNA-associated Sm-like protein LSm2 [Daktulosphaira vitifoliae]|uniref:U6 snRNA-associated Sm-like protein LSm2 n=1 Tax=Daktulosphaira vitifoliae TaxID=58002 RepID=UPI0021AB032C|nr:U6 snRNA-associated Sm-like protein LSm2 [Daktulosphaira vitifoliae]